MIAFRDVNPKAETHVLVVPERHLDSLSEIGEFGAEESKKMLDFIAETAHTLGLKDYRVITNVGHGGGQTVFHLHWHILAGNLPVFG